MYLRARPFNFYAVVTMFSPEQEIILILSKNTMRLFLFGHENSAKIVLLKLQDLILCVCIFQVTFSFSIRKV